MELLNVQFVKCALTVISTKLKETAAGFNKFIFTKTTKVVLCL